MLNIYFTDYGTKRLVMKDVSDAETAGEIVTALNGGLTSIGIAPNEIFEAISEPDEEVTVL